MWVELGFWPWKSISILMKLSWTRLPTWVHCNSWWMDCLTPALSEVHAVLISLLQVCFSKSCAPIPCFMCFFCELLVLMMAAGWKRALPCAIFCFLALFASVFFLACMCVYIIVWFCLTSYYRRWRKFPRLPFLPALGCPGQPCATINKIDRWQKTIPSPDRGSPGPGGAPSWTACGRPRGQPHAVQPGTSGKPTSPTRPPSPLIAARCVCPKQPPLSKRAKRIGFPSSPDSAPSWSWPASRRQSATRRLWGFKAFSSLLGCGSQVAAGRARMARCGQKANSLSSLLKGSCLDIRSGLVSKAMMGSWLKLILKFDQVTLAGLCLRLVEVALQSWLFVFSLPFFLELSSISIFSKFFPCLDSNRHVETPSLPTLFDQRTRSQLTSECPAWLELITGQFMPKNTQKHPLLQETSNMLNMRFFNRLSWGDWRRTHSPMSAIHCTYSTRQQRRSEQRHPNWMWTRRPQQPQQ